MSENMHVILFIFVLPFQMCHSETAEYQTIIRCTPELKTAVESHLTNLSGHLLAKHLISPEQDVELRGNTHTKCDRAAILVQLVTVKVEQNSGNYSIFIKILEENKNTFREILAILNKTHYSITLNSQ